MASTRDPCSPGESHIHIPTRMQQDIREWGMESVKAALLAGRRRRVAKKCVDPCPIQLPIPAGRSDPASGSCQVDFLEQNPPAASGSTNTVKPCDCPIGRSYYWELHSAAGKKTQ